METLEPTANDAFFKWNFFDSILSLKEYFSSYIFEDKAAEFLAKYPEIKQQFEKKKAEDTLFANDSRAQLTYIYEKSPYIENSYQQYPVYRLEE